MYKNFTCISHKYNFDIHVARSITLQDLCPFSAFF